jgi:hypothetical protein
MGLTVFRITPVIKFCAGRSTRTTQYALQFPVSNNAVLNYIRFELIYVFLFITAVVLTFSHISACLLEVQLRV